MTYGSGEDNELNKRPQIIASPKIMVTIFEQTYIALLDTGTATSVCSEALYNRIKQLAEKLIVMPTCGLYCSTAIGQKRQRIKLQSMFPVKIGVRIEEIIFLIIPNLAVDLIIGCDSFSNWEALIDFSKNQY